MDAVIRGVAIYFFIWLMVRIGGKRTLSQVTMFDFVLLLIISETTQQALVGKDYSITGAAILIVTFFGLEIALSKVQLASKTLDKILDDVPLIIVRDGQPLMDRLKKSRMDTAEVMEWARKQEGLERMDQIQYAVLERNGDISIIPKRDA